MVSSQPLPCGSLMMSGMTGITATAWRRAARTRNKVYAYDSGGATWGTPGKVYVSTDGGHTFTLNQGSVSAGLAANAWWTSAPRRAAAATSTS
jgi:hypothetical protein